MRSRYVPQQHSDMSQHASINRLCVLQVPDKKAELAHPADGYSLDCPNIQN